MTPSIAFQSEAVSVPPAKAAIAVHVYKEIPSPDEQISLAQLRNVLGHHPVFLTAPEGLALGHYQAVLKSALAGVKRFPASCFRSIRDYNRLMTNRPYYEAFGDFDYLLIHQPDVFVFRDELDLWVAKGYDYIGPPVYEYDGSAAPSDHRDVVFCGNGGFSLRKISSFLNLMDTYTSIYRAGDIIRDFRRYNWRGRVRRSWYYFILATGLGSRINPLFNRMKLNEDVVWGLFVPKYVPQFRVASLADSMKFGMEFNCARLVEQNAGVLPFGCHGWNRSLFREFWRPHIEAFGHRLEPTQGLQRLG